MLNNPALNSRIGTFNNSQQGTSALSLILNNLINLAFGLGGIILFFIVIWGGYEYLTAGGDKEATDRAKKRLTNGFVGIVVLFSVYALLKVVEVLFGINIRVFNIPNI